MITAFSVIIKSEYRYASAVWISYRSLIFAWKVARVELRVALIVALTFQVYRIESKIDCHIRIESGKLIRYTQALIPLHLARCVRAEDSSH